MRKYAQVPFLFFTSYVLPQNTYVFVLPDTKRGNSAYIKIIMLVSDAVRSTKCLLLVVL